MRLRSLFLGLLATLGLTACALRVVETTATARPSPAGATGAAPETTAAGADIRMNRRVEMEPLNGGFAQVVPFDGIPPIYDPQFAPAGEAPYLDEELVMGVTLDGQAKAYPVSVLRYREMVNDELAGIPILVTW